MFFFKRKRPKFYGLDELDRRIAEHVAEDAGTFVELGAFDGISQSNSLHFEEKGWRGVLIEPVPSSFEACRKNRPLARVFNCACVPFGQEGPVTINDVGLMSTIQGAMGAREPEWLERGAGFAGHAPVATQVPGRTLTAVLDEAGIQRVDLLLLDVEGFEIPVLNGLAFDRLAPTWIVAEDSYEDDLRQFIAGKGYEIVATLSERRFTRDTLFKKQRT